MKVGLYNINNTYLFEWPYSKDAGYAECLLFLSIHPKEISAIWSKGLLWTATILSFLTWMIGDVFHPLISAVVLHNDSKGNIGIPLYNDSIIPLVLLGILLFILAIARNNRNRTSNNLFNHPREKI